MARRLRTMPQALRDELASLGGEPAPAAAEGDMPAYEPDEHAASAAPQSRYTVDVHMVVFCDLNYRMRTLTSPAGNTIRVEQGLAVAVDDADIEWLDQHPDFERNT